MLGKSIGKRAVSKNPYLFTVKKRKYHGNREFDYEGFLKKLSFLLAVGALFFIMPKIYANPFKRVTVVDGYGEYTLLTRAKRMGDIYSSGVLNLKESDSTLSSDTPITADMVINVDRSIVANVISGSTNVRVRTRQGTAREVLKQAGIHFEENDAFNMPLDEPVKNGDTVVHAAIDTKTVTRRVTIDFDTVEVQDKTLAKGKTDVIFSGENGYKNVSYVITYKDGEEISRVKSGEKVIKQPVSRKIAIGAMDVVADRGSSSYASSSGGSGSSGSSSGRSSSSGRPSKPVIVIDSPKDLDPKRISSTKIMGVTAYTHTGRATATGVMPSRGTIAVDPRQIPLGTKLYVPGYGIGIAQDTGSMAPNTIDLFMDTYDECISWGRRSVTIYILKY